MNINELAQRCNVSVATISRVLNNSPKVNNKTRETILRIMNEEGYIPNAFARGLSLNSMSMVGIMCRDVSNPFYGKAVSLLEQSLRDTGYVSLLLSTGSKLKDKTRCLALLIQKKVDAIILVGAALREENDNTHIEKAAKQMPVFLLNADIDLPNVYCVFCNEKDAMRSNVRYLVESGCKNILYLHDMLSWAWAGSQKLEGYLLGLGDFSIMENKNLIAGVSTGVESSRMKVGELIKAGLEIDGIIASEDILAIGAQKALTDNGKNIPIIGFNNSLITDCATPPLTSVDNKLEVMCPMLIDLLQKKITGETIPAKTVVDSQLIERGTFRKRR
jgi:LacI family transcriptional regulator/LacI family asc operon transcriptional repressor